MNPLSSASADLLAPRNGLAIALVVAIVATLAVGIVWSANARMVEVSRGEGRVIPSGRIRTVQNLEGGIVQAIHVSEGARVAKGDRLISIDPIQAGATLAENRVQTRALEASVVWLQAVLDGRKPAFPTPEDATHARLIERNAAEYAATRDELASALASVREQARQKRSELDETVSRLASAQRSLAVASEQAAMMAKLRRSGAASRNEALTAKARKVDLQGEVEALSLARPRLEAAIAEASARETETKSRFRSRLSTRLNEAFAKLEALRETVNVDADRVRRAELRSPVAGIVKVLHANTIGQVVKPAEHVVEIVPAEDSLLVRVEIDPKDIAFLHEGQDAVVRLTAYDFALYGSLKGKVVRVGADSIVDDRGRTHFPVDVRADAAFVASGEERLPVLPGMVAQVDIVTGHKTIFDYVTKPIHRTANGAFGER